MLSTYKHHPEKATETLRPIAESGHDPDALLAMAEMTFHIGKRHEILQPGEAMVWYRDSAAYASFCLQQGESVDTVLAEEVHDVAVAHLIRIATRPIPMRDPWSSQLARVGIMPRSPVLFLSPERVDNIHLASDLFVRGMNVYHKRPGFGVPIVASRRVDKDAPLDVQDTLYPRELELPATVVIRPEGPLAGGAWRSLPVWFEVHDSYNEAQVTLGAQSLPLAADFSTPIAYAANRSEVRNLGIIGTVNPVKAIELAGVIMPRPYEPGKIPVVFIHGLASEPSTWLAAYNDLIGDPEIRKRYQLWSVRYPSGEPLLASALTIRKSIRETYAKLDPSGADPALKGMIVVGHSMGGIMAKLLVTNSGDAFWNATFTRPFTEVNAPGEMRTLLADHYFMSAEPYITRIVFIASPHRGSRMATALPGRLSSSLVRADDQFTKGRKAFIELNGIETVQSYFRGSMLNGVSGLSPDNPNLKANGSLPIPRGIPYHNIIAVLNHGSDVPLDRINDGVVYYTSAHLDGAQSEMFVRSWHGCLDKPETAKEVARILRQHLAELDAKGGATRISP